MKDIYGYAFAGCKNLEEVYCYCKTKFSSLGSDIFKDSYVGYATLYVPEEAMDYYTTTSPWKEFGTIKSLEGKEQKKCATPVIEMVNGKVKFTCETEGAKFHYAVTATVNDSGTGAELALKSASTYTITCYATADGYLQSETATKTVTLETSGNSSDVNGDGKVDINDVNAVINAICGGK